MKESIELGFFGNIWVRQNVMEGAGESLSRSTARLVVETSEYSLMFNGKISKDGKCEIPIRKLKGLIDESSKGNIRLEVIAEDTFFTPWETNFEVEKIGLVKFDFLGLRTLTVIDRAIKSINYGKNESEIFDIESIPLNDQKVFQLLSSGKTMAVFQLESSGMRDLIKSDNSFTLKIKFL